MHDLPAHPPRGHPAKREVVVNLRFEGTSYYEVHFEVQIVQQIFHEVVNHLKTEAIEVVEGLKLENSYICFINLTKTIHVKRIFWVDQTEQSIQAVDRNHHNDANDVFLECKCK